MTTNPNLTTRFISQTHRRTKWFILSILTGTIAALIFEAIEHGAYPAWKVGVLVAGVMFFPFLIRDEKQKGYVSRWTTIKEIRKRRRP